MVARSEAVRRGVGLALCLQLLAAGVARAHDVRGSAVYLDVGTRGIAIELHLPLTQLRLVLPLPDPTGVSAGALRDCLGQHVGGRARDGTPLQLAIDRIESQRDELVVAGRLVPARDTALRWFPAPLLARGKRWGNRVGCGTARSPASRS